MAGARRRVLEGLKGSSSRSSASRSSHLRSVDLIAARTPRHHQHSLPRLPNHPTRRNLIASPRWKACRLFTQFCRCAGNSHQPERTTKQQRPERTMPGSCIMRLLLRCSAHLSREQPVPSPNPFAILRETGGRAGGQVLRRQRSTRHLACCPLEARYPQQPAHLELQGRHQHPTVVCPRKIGGNSGECKATADQIT